jgi:hypothetical protein
MHYSLDGIGTPAGPRCDGAIRVNLRVLFGRIFPALLKVDKGFPHQSLAMASVKSVNQVCVSKFIDACMIGQESTLATIKYLWFAKTFGFRTVDHRSSHTP